MGSCCRRASTSPALVNTRNFCASLSMTTPITLVDTGSTFDIMVLTPGGQKTSLSGALASFRCAAGSTAGIRLAAVVVAALNRLTQIGGLENLRSRIGRQMPLLMLKEQLFRLVDKCPACNGSGCTECSGTGFST